ncbi:RIP metalloprotease RseP [bacterium]|nr:RIP metalloprotease RseP [bacterium]
MILTIIIVFISLIGLLILHEFGHFIIAKWCGVKVEEFGIGYPPRLFGKKIGETIYSLNLIPLGAFVRVLGEEGGKTTSIEDCRSFSEKPIWQRALIVLGGVLSFWIIAAILLSIVFGLGTYQAISDEEKGPLINPKVQILTVSSNSPAEKAGLRMGDAIMKIGTQKSEIKEVKKAKEVQEFIKKHLGEDIILVIERGKKVFEISLTPRVSPPEGEGPIGITLVRTAKVKEPWWKASIKGIQATLQITALWVVGLVQIVWNLLCAQGLPPGASFVGPVGIGALMTQAVQVGLSYYLKFVALVSIGLAIFNILPIPALDGGKLLFLMIEKIKGSPVDQKIEQRITAVSFAILIALVIWITIQDIQRLL